MKDVSSVAAVGLGGHFHGSVLQMILDAGLMVKFVLLLLLVFSVVSWAIILVKRRSIKKVKKENTMFMDAYMNSNKLSDIFPQAKKYKYSTMAAVFQAGYMELIKITKAVGGGVSHKESDESTLSQLELRGIDNVERSLNKACSSEATRLESTLGFLATTGSASPFIGLFGTVWGIMDTFRGIGTRGSATLAVVAPGISEALIATAAGLAAAIPAVIFYNYYLNVVKDISAEMDNFASEILNIIERNFVRK